MITKEPLSFNQIHQNRNDAIKETCQKLISHLAIKPSKNFVYSYLNGVIFLMNAYNVQLFESLSDRIKCLIGLL